MSAARATNTAAGTAATTNGVTIATTATAAGADQALAARHRTELWWNIFGLLREIWLAQPLASVAMVALMLAGNA
ncbi:MAG: hypothetical protein HY332_05370 [Chloroflexi bacterium]|nr:hypothetical protein [Chloroflexota bacterium]